MSLSQTNQAPPIRFEGTSKKKLKPAVVVGWKRAGALEVPLIGNVEQLSAGLAVHGIDLLALEPAVGTGEADLCTQSSARAKRRNSVTPNHDDHGDQPPERTFKNDPVVVSAVTVK
jgi:hypothetical protein